MDGGYVYFIAAEELGAVKIGLASDPVRRLSGLQSGCPSRLKIVGVIYFHTYQEARSAEADFHKKFDGLWMQGEWFRLGMDIAEYLVNDSRLYIPPQRSEEEKRSLNETVVGVCKKCGEGMTVRGRFLHRCVKVVEICDYDEVVYAS